jgi:hypothetical protein
MPWPGRCVRSAVWNGPSSSSTGSQIRRSERRSNAGLNKGKARNSLARALFFHRHGEIRDRTFENQRYPASGLNLTIAAIVLSDSKLNATESPKLFATEKKSRDIIVLLLE